MSANGVKNFIAAVDLVYPAPQFNGEKARQTGWVGLMTSELSGYPDDVLATVGKTIVRERKPEDGRFFPLLSEIIPMCNEMMESRRALPMLEGPKEPPEWSSERIALARDIMQTPLGKQADREGWDTAMFHFCIRNLKAPSGKELDECKRTSKEFSAEHERCIKGEREHGPAWARYAESMVRKARELMEKSA